MINQWIFWIGSMNKWIGSEKIYIFETLMKVKNEHY